MWPGGPIMMIAVAVAVVVAIMITMMMREVHKCGQVCLFLKVGQVASNWETPRGSYSQICLTKKWSVTIKPIVLHSQFLSFATKDQNNTPRNKVNLTLTLLHCSGPMKRYKVMESSRKSSANNFPQLWLGNHQQGLRGSGDRLRWFAIMWWMITCHVIVALMVGILSPS